jgi:hypothetical protein
LVSIAGRSPFDAGRSHRGAKTPASNSEAQAEGDRVFSINAPHPSARASGFSAFSFARRELKMCELRGFGIDRRAFAF